MLYSHHLNHNEIVSTTANETLTKRITNFYARKDNYISPVHIVIAKSANSYSNQTMISNAALYLEGNILNDTTSNAVTVNTNSEVAIFTTSGHGSSITLSNESESNAHKLICNTLIKREKEDTPKVYNAFEKSIGIDTHKSFHSADCVSIKYATTNISTIGFDSKNSK